MKIFYIVVSGGGGRGGGGRGGRGKGGEVGNARSPNEYQRHK